MTYYEALTVAYEAAPDRIGPIIALVMLVSAIIVLIDKVLTRVIGGHRWAVKRVVKGFLNTDDPELKPIAEALRALPGHVESFESMGEIMRNLSTQGLLQTYYTLMEQRPMNGTMYRNWVETYNLHIKQGWNGGLETCRKDLGEKKRIELAGG